MHNFPQANRPVRWLHAVWLAAAPLLVSFTGGCASAIKAPGDDGLDHEKMVQIERAARATGVSVHWVNPPRRRS